MKKLFTTTMLTLGMALATASASAALTQQQEDKILEKLKPEIDALVLDMVGGEEQYFTLKDGKRVHLPIPIDPKEEAKIAAKLDAIAKKNGIVYPYIAQADKFLEMFYIYFPGEEGKQKYSLAKMPVYKSIKALEKCIMVNAPLCPRKASVGSTYLGDGDVDNAVKWFNITAKSGHGDSAFMLALLNIDGKFLPKNPTQAKKYYKQAFDIHMKNRDLAAAKEVNDHYKESLNDNRGLDY